MIAAALARSVLVLPLEGMPIRRSIAGMLLCLIAVCALISVHLNYGGSPWLVFVPVPAFGLYDLGVRLNGTGPLPQRLLARHAGFFWLPVLICLPVWIIALGATAVLFSTAASL